MAREPGHNLNLISLPLPKGALALWWLLLLIGLAGCKSVDTGELRSAFVVTSRLTEEHVDSRYWELTPIQVHRLETWLDGHREGWSSHIPTAAPPPRMYVRALDAQRNIVELSVFEDRMVVEYDGHGAERPLDRGEFTDLMSLTGVVLVGVNNRR